MCSHNNRVLKIGAGHKIFQHVLFILFVQSILQHVTTFTKYEASIEWETRGGKNKK